MPRSRSVAKLNACSWFIGGDVVEPVEIGQGLQIGLVFDQLLRPAVQQADMGIDALYDFAVELEHETQHSVRRRMLRPEIDGEIAKRCLVHPGSLKSLDRCRG